MKRLSIILFGIVLLLSGCGTNSSEINDLKSQIKLLESQIKQKNLEIETLKNNNQNTTIAPQVIKGTLILSTNFESTVDGSQQFAYVFREFQTDIFYVFTSKEKLDIEINKVYDIDTDGFSIVKVVAVE